MLKLRQECNDAIKASLVVMDENELKTSYELENEAV